ncbi:MAG: hypothetical protein A2855_02075 [Candidatus Liptonbacteria bacterium RIFCSPHIGHO2_01_FULL_57_28]|uniref:Putative pterin-4-alpha-carbinolamine dehydratase n=1 Tax=Candidatus Liptonbacteria bacterium RIFCSPHIGHO2_01_FULL_57_28 TaxID=1798647 RepID=A0A1G2CB68_9BACT|nr:MAG: hypothetical protein A2855_02075 [Candidatus Liptonbacteria bacterium RIFCSPHIGHO2_01_FULL_57_28]
MAIHLSEKRCVACEGDVPPLTAEQAKIFAQEVNTDWQIGEKEISRHFKFKDFKEAMAFVNKVAEVANEENHHPDIYIFYNKVDIKLTTHAIRGLSENDFIMAAKIDKLPL